MEKTLLTVSELLEKYHHPLKLILSAILLFGSGLLLARVVDYKKRPKLDYQSNLVYDSEATKRVTGTVQSDVKIKEVKVDVSGAVVNPGVYSLPFGKRVEDALKEAGGIRDDADKEWVSRHLNLAEKISDGSKVYIPKRGEALNNSQVAGGFESYVSVGGALDQESLGCPAKININTASSEILTCLYNVGEARAQAIIDYRSQTPFGSIEEITNIKGIGEKTLERIRDKITVR